MSSWRPWLVALLGALVLLAGCGHGGASDRTLSYSTSAEPDALTITVADNRPGAHTVWVVLRDPPKGVPRVWLTAQSHGDEGRAGGVSARRELPPGTYRFVVYSAPGNALGGAEAQYWTPEHRVGEGVAEVN